MKQYIFRFLVLLLSITLIPLVPLCFAAIEETQESNFTILDISSGETLSLTQKEYLIGAVFAQIDVNYNIEALKSQAVIAYTNALFEKDKNKNESFDFKVDISREILYIDQKTAKEKHKEKYDDLLKKVEQAVDFVKDQKITYNSQIVLLPFFELCFGATEDAYTVWGEEIGYLKSVESGGDLLCPNSKTSLCFSVEEICNIVKQRYSTQVSSDTTNFITIGGRTNSGTVTCCNIENLTMTGQNLRSLLGLPSANFDITCDGNIVEITCYGKGHYVGLSQYGADFMARQGISYVDILKHYYTDIEVKS